MKNIVNHFACVALVILSVACQKEPVMNETTGDPASVVITAARPQTKVAYSENGSTHNLEGSWEVDDVIFGFTASGTTVSFNVTSVAPGTGVATLTQTTSVDLTEGTKVHAIYCPGKTASDLSEQTLAVDFSSQSESVIPVLLLATATVTSNTLAFTFENAVSVVCIKNPIFPAATTADRLVKITLSGHEIVSSGVVSVSGGNLVFTGNAPDKFITKTVNATPKVSGDEFTIDDPVYIVVPAGPIANVSAIDTKSNFFLFSLNQTADVSKYYVLDGKYFSSVPLPISTGVSASGVVWARANLGGTGVTDMGDIYRWSDVGRIYTARPTSTTVTFDSAHSSGFTTYEGECYYTETPSAGYTKYNKSDNKLVLDPVDDLVQLTYPGSGWRMPTLAEFNAVLASGVTYNSGSGNSVGTTVKQDENTLFFRSTTQVCIPSGGNYTSISSRGYYWTSSISEGNLTSNGGRPDYVEFNPTNGRTAAAPVTGSTYRNCGLSIRPVRE